MSRPWCHNGIHENPQRDKRGSCVLCRRASDKAYKKRKSERERAAPGYVPPLPAANRTPRVHRDDARPGRVYVADIRAGRCPGGHDISEARSRVNMSGRIFCRECRERAGVRVYTRRPNVSVPGMCRQGLHPYAGKGRCLHCARERRTAAWQRYEERQREAAAQVTAVAVRAELPAYLRRGLPSVEILDGAVCTPAQAPMFEPISRSDFDGGRSEPLADAKTRQAAAIRICAGCPVRELCAADGHRYTREGVYGGVAMSYRYHRARKLGLAS